MISGQPLSPAPQPKGGCLGVKALIGNAERAICRSLAQSTILLVALLAAPMASAQTGPSLEQRFATSLTALPSEKLGVTGSFYVPAYSSVSLSEGRLRADFSVTLNIHNASETRPLVLRRIAYFDTNGNPVQSYLKEPVALKPFATIEVFIPTTDVRGGTGANFIVDWAADGPVAEPRDRGADARRPRHRAICVHQPGPAGEGDRGQLDFAGLRCHTYPSFRGASFAKN
jgi:hypothetical protein